MAVEQLLAESDACDDYTQIKKICVAPGDTVEAGQLLIVTESIPDRYSIHADFGMVVEEIAVKVGEKVETGQVILTYTRLA